MIFFLWIVPTWTVVNFIKDHRAAGRFTSSALKVLFALMGCPVRVVGKEYMDTPGAKMYAANHTSYFDVLPLMLGLGVPYRFVAKMEVHGMPFIGTFLRQMGHLSFDRTDANSRLRQAEEMEEILRRGESVFVFPEGTFTADDGIRPFQLGAFKAAVAAGVPIIPVSLAGTRRFLREGTYLPRPTRVTITLSRPIYPHWRAPGRAAANLRTGTNSFACAIRLARPSRATSTSRCCKRPVLHFAAPTCNAGLATRICSQQTNKGCGSLPSCLRHTANARPRSSSAGLRRHQCTWRRYETEGRGVFTRFSFILRRRGARAGLFQARRFRRLLVRSRKSFGRGRSPVSI